MFWIKKSLVIAVCAFVSTSALAQSRPITILVGSPPGGATDLVARHLADGLQHELNAPVIVQNRPGAGGQIAAQTLKASASDGLTLFLSNSHTLSMIPLTALKPGFNAERDFLPIGLVASQPDVFVLNSTIAKFAPSLKDFVAWTKKTSGAGNVGVPAPASAPAFAVSLIAHGLGGDLSAVTYRGDAAMLQDLLGGQIPAAIGSVGGMLASAAAGRIRIVAVNGTQRLSNLPNVPTYKELGIFGYEEVMFTALFAPAGTPSAVLAQYSASLEKVVKSSTFTSSIATLGMLAQYGSAEDVKLRLEKSSAASERMVKAVGYRAE